MDKSVWKEAIREDADKKGVGPYDRCEGRVCAEEEKSVSIVKGGEREGKRICERTVAKGIYLAVKVTANGAGILCREERWEEMDGVGLQISE